MFNRNSRQRSVAAICALALTSCASDPFGDGVSSVHTDGDVEMITRNPELDVVVFKSPGDVEKFCMSAETDAVPTDSVGFALSYRGAQASETSGAGAGILGGRSAAVLIARDILYRTCEISLNYDLSKDEALALFNTALEKVQAVAATDAQAGAAALGVEDDVARN
ncbi:MAG: hypothetical protein AAGJ87_11555 [Pseudomonadota bacterium]